MFRLATILSISFTFLAGCNSKSADIKKEELARYQQEVNAWHEHRLEEVKARNGWLNLVGLFWLEPGINSFGSGAKNKIVFPDSTIEHEAGYFLVRGGSVDMHLNADVKATDKGEPVSVQTVFNPDSTRQPQIENEKISWTIIRRDGKFGVRIRDLSMEGVRSFKGIERFPVDPAYRLDASFQPSAGRNIDVTNVLGQTTAQVSPGTIVFNWEGVEHHLDVLEGNKDEYFVIIADETSGSETYGGGRYLYVKHADAQGRVIIDFNKAYNPPCVFTPFATCPLPPRQNVLPFSVRAGEKVYGKEYARHG